MASNWDPLCLLIKMSANSRTKAPLRSSSRQRRLPQEKSLKFPRVSTGLFLPLQVMLTAMTRRTTLWPTVTQQCHLLPKTRLLPSLLTVVVWIPPILIVDGLPPVVTVVVVLWVLLLLIFVLPNCESEKGLREGVREGREKETEFSACRWWSVFVVAWHQKIINSSSCTLK